MINISAWDMAEMILATAKLDSENGETGWAQLGPIRCSYYPVSKTCRWWLTDGPVNGKNEALRTLDNWLRSKPS